MEEKSGGCPREVRICWERAAIKAHKVRSGAAAVKFCFPNLRFVLCLSVLFGLIHGQKRVWTGANVVAAASDPIKSF